jgi:hypothetical protein
MSILERAKTHFESIGVQSIEVPEWKDEDGKPTVIFWNPINLFEKNKLFKKSENLSDVSILDDKMDLMTKVDSDVLSRIATAMIQVATPEEVKKN